MSTLYRTYRPKTFADVIGQEHTVKTLKNAITHNRIGHAYLFTGPRGTGKTSIARIFATAVSCTERKGFTHASDDVCKRLQDGSSLDIIEIDAASHTGVDNIRELRESIVLPPTEAPFKVYIIDEVHMLSQGAFNALLKTLEEPPAHALFILATTEIHKVPETILSRCQRFDFTRLTLGQITQKLATIAKSEGVKIEKEALEMIAIVAEGGMRDAESLLSQVLALEDKKVTAEEVAAILGTSARADVMAFVETLVTKDPAAGITLVNRLATEGYDLATFAKSTVQTLRALLFLTVEEKLTESLSLELSTDEQKQLLAHAQATTTQEVIQAIEDLSEASTALGTAFIPQLPLEIAIVRICGAQAAPSDPQKPGVPAHEPAQPQKNPAQTSAPKAATAAPVAAATTKDPATQPHATQKAPEATEPQSAPAKPQAAEATASTLTLADIRSAWDTALTQVKANNGSLAGLLSGASIAAVDSGTVTLSVQYDFHREKLMDHANKALIEQTFTTLCKQPVTIAATVAESTQPAQEEKQKDATKSSDLLTHAATLMGGGTIVES